MTSVEEAIADLRKNGVKRIGLITFLRKYNIYAEHLGGYVHDHPGDIGFSVLGETLPRTENSPPSFTS